MKWAGRTCLNLKATGEDVVGRSPLHGDRKHE